MNDNSDKLTSFNLGPINTETENEGMLSKFFVKVKLAVSSNPSTHDKSAVLQDKLNSNNLLVAKASSTSLTSDFSIQTNYNNIYNNYNNNNSNNNNSNNNNNNTSYPISLSHSVTDLAPYTSHSRTNSFTNGDSTLIPSVSATPKASAITSVVITTATATNSRRTSISSMEKLNNNNNTTATATTSNTDHVHFSNSTDQLLNDSIKPAGLHRYTGSDLFIPMAKSKSVDSDAQSVATNFSISNTNSLGKIMARLRGQKNDKEFWMPDEQCKECYKCRKQFTMFRRKHHCRFCGQIFCGKCASHIIPGKLYNQKGQIRVCNFCYTEQHIENNSDTSFVTAGSRTPSKYETIEKSTSNEQYEPVIPSQNPPLAPPMMQIPTTAVKRSHSKYGDENTTTVALEIPAHEPSTFYNDNKNQHPTYQYGSYNAPKTPLNYNGTSGMRLPINAAPNYELTANDLDTSGGIKRFLDAGTSLLKQRSRSNTTHSCYVDDSKQQISSSIRTGSGGGSSGLSPNSISRGNTSNINGQQQQIRYMDHGGGTVVKEGALSSYLDIEEDEETLSRNNSDSALYGLNMLSDGNNRPNGGSISRNHSGSSYNFHPSPFRRGQSFAAASQSKVSMESSNSAAGSDNESYDVQLRSKRASELRGSPLRKRSFTTLRRHSTSSSGGSRGKKDRFRSIKINTSNLPRFEGVNTFENWSPSPFSAYVGTNNINNSTNYGMDGIHNLSADFLNYNDDLKRGNRSTILTDNSNSIENNSNNSNNNVLDINNSNHSNNNNKDDLLLVPNIKSKYKYKRHRRISAPSVNVELSNSALGHARKLFRQLINETHLYKLAEDQKMDWENAMMNLLLKLADHIQPDVRAGDDMDIRHYVKIKKIPGGRPSDSFYVKGVMCSKNVAHKRMARNISEPKILILLFSLDYSRVEMENQLLSISPVISQERQHISKLVGRIIALRPSLLLVKSTVSRLALEILLEANITVVHNLKDSVIEAIARSTQAAVIPSVDKLHGDISFGVCKTFEIRTFLHEWIPNRRKTFLLFDDCPPELGGTLILRGGTMETLYIMKRIMDFMVFVVNNLKLETALLRDSFAKNRGLEQAQIVATPKNDKDKEENNHQNNTSDLSNENDLTTTHHSILNNNNNNNDHTTIYSNNHSDDDEGDDDDHYNLIAESHNIDDLDAFLKIYHDAILSASQYVVFPPPYLLTRLKETKDKLIELQKEMDSEPVTTPSSTLLSPTRTGFDKHALDPSLRGPNFLMYGTKFELLEAKHHQLSLAWGAYVRESPDYINPYYHQNIVVLYSNVCTPTTMPCQGPEIRVFEYYRYPSDMTLGEYLMDLFDDAMEPCPSPMCEHPTMNHYLSYAHGEARVNVITQHFECPIKGMSDKLLMWSYCKECKKATQVARVSENTWNYSFGKFLEIFLYQQGVYCRADICPHEIGRYHVRYFGYMNMSVRFQYETIDLLEVETPPTKLFMLSQVQIDLKENELKSLRTKINKFYQSIIERNKAFPFDLVDPLQLEACKAELEELSDRSVGTKKKVLQILQNIYATTAKNDTLTINWVRRILYQEVTEWELEYTDIVRHYLLPERELKKITASQLRKMFPSESAPEGLANGEIGNERIKRSSITTDLPLLGIELESDDDDYDSNDNDEEKYTIGYEMDGHFKKKNIHTPPQFLPSLSTSPSDKNNNNNKFTTINYLKSNNKYDDDIDEGEEDSDTDDEIKNTYTMNNGIDDTELSYRSSLLRPSIRRRLSRELNRELQIRFRIPEEKDGRMSPSNQPNNKSPSNISAAMAPSRIPIPNININNTGRPQLSPPLYEAIHNNLRPRLALANMNHTLSIPPMKVPLASELNVATPRPRIPTIKEPIYQNLRLPSPRENQVFNKQNDRFNNGLQSQSLQHIPSMFKSKYANDDHGRRALSSIKQKSISLNSNTNGGGSNLKHGSRRQINNNAHFRSKLPRKKTYIQVYTHANELVREDMDDEFLISDIDDFGDLETNNNNNNSNYNHNYRNTSDGIRRLGPGTIQTPQPQRIQQPLKISNSIRDHLSVYTDNLTGYNNNSNKENDNEPIDYFSPQAPYSGASIIPQKPKSEINTLSVMNSPATTKTIGRPSMLERLDTEQSIENSNESTERDNQIPSASELLSSPAAIVSEMKEVMKANIQQQQQQLLQKQQEQQQLQQKQGSKSDEKLTSSRESSLKLPRNALHERQSRRALDYEENKQTVEKNSFMKTITSFLTDNGSANLLPLEHPLNPMEHVLPDSFVIVKEDEPSSIIAYTLSCDDYIKKMKEMRGSNYGDTNSLSDDAITISESVDESTLDQVPSVSAISLLMNKESEMNQAEIQETLLKESGNHMRYNFSDGTTKFFCKAFHTEQFDALRRHCGCDETYILSLASCIKWDCTGGKSGSAFLKTKDDRFLMKQMSKFELDAFLGFAPAYFQYLSKSFFTELPTVLAKIFGFYSIGYKNSSTGNSMRMDVLVMENLFYQRKVKKIFDLKGSMRNRHVESTGKKDEVLLDENLVELIFQKPLFIRAHSKELLRSSIYNDTLFLSGRNVMDYSLLVGIDEERNELIVGIVDFIRTFTWDKKLESWVKESVFLGGGGKEPTIVTPKQYRLRFRAAMERYFLMVPNIWAMTRQNTLTYPNSNYHHHPEQVDSE
ncbi:unnamed protein product [Cunninghamella echinulata]